MLKYNLYVYNKYFRYDIILSDYAQYTNKLPLANSNIWLLLNSNNRTTCIHYTNYYIEIKQNKPFMRKYNLIHYSQISLQCHYSDLFSGRWPGNTFWSTTRTGAFKTSQSFSHRSTVRSHRFIFSLRTYFTYKI